ncbi:DUF1684 domain-containing protein [Streptomyces sp. NPDC001351]|uniref:DUF1684 domain-containing protein n=1 Tax=Streptomyces sp. NPDC001351 TaxID=3364564 RepID=UPI0036C67F80
MEREFSRGPPGWSTTSRTGLALRTPGTSPPLRDASLLAFDARARAQHVHAPRRQVVTARLVTTPEGPPGRKHFAVAGATEGAARVARARAGSLALEPPAADGTVVLDFDRATNLVRAYTDLATCPLPRPKTAFPVAIEAGQKTPRERGGS